MVRLERIFFEEEIPLIEILELMLRRDRVRESLLVDETEKK